MNETLRALVRMAEGAEPELQVAAAQVLGELRPTEPAVARALGRCLGAAQNLQARYLLEALAKIGSPEAVRALIEHLAGDGPHVELAARLLGDLGAQATRALGALFDGASSELRGRILEILGRHQDRDALRALLRAVLAPDAGLSDKAATVLEQHVGTLDDRGRKLLLDSLHESLTAKAVAEMDRTALANALRVLGRLGGAAARATLVRCAGPKQEPAVRQAALLGLAGAELTAAQSDALLGFLSESDMTHVVRPTIEVLERVEKWGSGGVQRLKKLVASRNEELSLFALRALRNCRTAEVAKLCMKHLTGGKQAWQEAAAIALGENPAALAGLLRALSLEKDPERARVLAGSLARLRKHVKGPQLEALADKAGKLIAAAEPMGDVLLELLLQVSPERGSRALVDKALRLRRARKLPECLAILMRIAATDRIDPEGRYHLAVTRLLSDETNGQMDKAGRAGDATMGYFTMLVRAGFPLLDRLKKESQISPAALLRLGTHFAEGVAGERRFGVDLLQYVAERHRRSKVGEEARYALRAEGV